MIKILKSFTAKVWAGALLLLVLTGLLVGFTRLLLPLASEYRDQLALDLSRAIGAPVRIQSLNARLAGLSPELQLSGVEVLDPRDGGVQLRFGELRLRVSLMASLRGGVPRVGLATIVGARLVLRRRKNGEILLIGLGDEQEAGAAGATTFSPEPFLSQGRLRLLDSEILWDNRLLGLPALRIRVEEAQLANAGARHQLAIRGDLTGDDTDGGKLDIRADFFGAPDQPANWQGELYFKSTGLDLHPLLGPFLPSQWQPHGVLDAEIWSRWEQGQLLSAEGRGHLLRPSLGALGHERPVLESVSARLALHRETPGGLRLDLWDLRLLRDGQIRPPSILSLHWRPTDDGAQQVSARLDRLRIDDLAYLLGGLPFATDWREDLQTLDPRGRLENLQLRLGLAADADPQWQASGRITGLGLESLGSTPALSGLNLLFRADTLQGEVRLSSSNLSLRLADLFRDPLQVEHLDGELQWSLDSDGAIRIRSDALVLDTAHLKTRNRLKIRVPADGAPLFLDLQTDFRDGDASATSLYLPVGILSDELVAWLDQSIISGRVSSGSFILRGSGDTFPYYDRDGVFEVLFGVEDTILDYQEGWPRLEEIDAEVRFFNEAMSIALVDARMLESRVRSARAHVPDLDRSRLLYLKGRVDGPFADTFRILRETPLAEGKARYVQGMRARGRSRVDLDADIPMEDGAEYRVEGSVTWTRAETALVFEDADLNLERLKGSLRFDNEGVYAQAIQASLWGKPVQLSVDTRPGGPGRTSITRIDANLQLDSAELGWRFPHPLWRRISGSTPANLSLSIDHGTLEQREIPINYRMESLLNGIRIDFPAPLNKGVESVRPFFIEGTLPATQGARIAAGYGDIQGALRLGRNEDAELSIKAAAVACGTQSTPSVVQNGFRLDGRIGLLELDAWLELFADLHTGTEAEGDELQRPSRRVQLHIDRLQLGQTGLEDVSLDMVRTPSAWDAEFDSKRLSGMVRMPDDPRSQPVSVRLRRLNLDFEEWDVKGGQASGEPWPDPRQSPSLDLEIEDLRLNGASIGRLKLVTRPIVDGLLLDRLGIEGKLLTLTGRGSWTGRSGEQRTSLVLEGHSPNLGDALRELKFTSALAEADMHMQADLYWDSPPMDLNLANVVGELDFEVGKGRVLEVDPGVGRLFGLLNLGALQRRLTLDFSDLFGAGYSFDNMAGHFNLTGGQAHADKVTITGPSADLEITGRTGLVDQDYEQLVTVTPEISATLPVAGAIVGGPIVAAALLLAKQVMGDEVNKLSRFQYHVTGPWLEPEIRRVETSDDWSLSNLFQPDDKAHVKVQDTRDKSPFLQ